MLNFELGCWEAKDLDAGGAEEEELVDVQDIAGCGGGAVICGTSEALGCVPSSCA